MKINTGIKAGVWNRPKTKAIHNEGQVSVDKSKNLEILKTVKTKLRLKKRNH